MPSEEFEDVTYTTVLLEGTRTPCVELAEGERQTRLRTPYVDTMIEQGYVRVISEEETPVSDESGDDVTPPETGEEAKTEDPETAPKKAAARSR